jgi:hypothetical protein
MQKYTPLGLIMHLNELNRQATPKFYPPRAEARMSPRMDPLPRASGPRDYVAEAPVCGWDWRASSQSELEPLVIAH